MGAQIFENSLPEHLRGKRPKDMDPKEKKEYNNYRRKMSRANESKEQSNERLKKEAEKKATKIEQEVSNSFKTAGGSGKTGSLTLPLIQHRDGGSLSHLIA